MRCELDLGRFGPYVHVQCVDGVPSFCDCCTFRPDGIITIDINEVDPSLLSHFRSEVSIKLKFKIPFTNQGRIQIIKMKQTDHCRRPTHIQIAITSPLTAQNIMPKHRRLHRDTLTHKKDTKQYFLIMINDSTPIIA